MKKKNEPQNTKHDVSHIVQAKADEAVFRTLLESGGMGLNIIRQTVSSIYYERKNDQNELTMHFPLVSFNSQSHIHPENDA